jgi:hypothetical protein
LIALHRIFAIFKIVKILFKIIFVKIMIDAAFAYVAFYVALSRAMRLSDLMLFGIDKFPEHRPTSMSIASLRK